MDLTSRKKRKQVIAKTRSKSAKKDVETSPNKILISNSKNANKKKKKVSRKGNGIIYIGSIPHGFYEDEMRSYFNQFGKVMGTFVARSKKTGRSKGYGFVEFNDEEVAKIAAESMNNYLMFNRIIKCRYIPPEERKGKVSENKIRPSNYPRQKYRIINDKNNMKALSNLTGNSYLEKAQKKVEQFKKFFTERGINFSFELKSKGDSCNNSTEANKTTALKTSSVSDSVSEDDRENEFGVLEIDESENEISFKTPPQVKKVIIKSLNSPNVRNSGDSQVKKRKASLSNTNSNKLSKKESTKHIRKGVNLKLHKETKGKEKFVKSLKAKKDLLAKEAKATVIQKKTKGRENATVTGKQQKSSK